MMRETTLADVFADADPARSTPSSPAAPQQIAAAVHRRVNAVPDAPGQLRPHRTGRRTAQLGLASAAAVAALTAGVISWPYGTHQPTSSAWAVTAHADHTVTVNVGTGPGTQTIADRLHADLRAAGLDIPVYLSSPPGGCTTPLHLRIANNDAYPATSAAHPSEMTIKPDQTPAASTLILAVDDGQPSLAGRFIIGALPHCIPYSDSPADGGVTPVEER